MELKKQEISYSHDSQRTRNPGKTGEELLKQLEKDFEVVQEELTHSLSPDLKTVSLKFNQPLYWEKKASTLGKGLTYEQTLASAAAEYVERYSATQYIENHQNENQDGKTTIAPEDLYPERGIYARLQRKIRRSFTGQSWTEFYSLKKQEAVDLPFEVMTDTTNGLAAGNNLEEAVMNGIFEVLERDQQYRSLDRINTENIKQNTFIRPQDLPEDLKKQFDTEELEKLLIIHSRSQLCPEVHVFIVLAAARTRKNNLLSPQLDLFMGRGANLDPEYGLQRALTETLQMLAAGNAGQLIKPEPRIQLDYTELQKLENNFQTDLKKNIETCTENLETGEDILVKDITTPKYSLNTTKTVITNSYGPSRPRIGPSFFKDVLNIELTTRQKIGLKTMTAAL